MRSWKGELVYGTRETKDDAMPRCEQAVNFGSVNDFYLISLLSTKPRRLVYWVLGSGCHNR